MINLVTRDPARHLPRQAGRNICVGEGRGGFGHLVPSHPGGSQATFPRPSYQAARCGSCTIPPTLCASVFKLARMAIHLLVNIVTILMMGAR